MLGNGRRNAGNIGFLKESRPMRPVGTCPPMMTMGIESMLAVAMPVTMLHTPGPDGDADAGPAGNAGVAVPGSVDRSLFMTGKDVPEVVFIHFFV